MTPSQKQARFNARNTITPTGLPMLSVDGQIGPLSRRAFDYAEHTWGTGWEDVPLPTPVYAVDSFGAVAQSTLDMLKAETGALPKWWGRYLGQLGKDEVPVLEKANIPALMIDNRSIYNVNKNRETGTYYGKIAITNMIKANALGVSALRKIFLDVEMPDQRAGIPPLAASFYIGWSATIVDAGYEPGIYLPSSMHPDAWHALSDAVSQGAPCAGTWVAGYFSQSMAACDDGTSTFMYPVWDKRAEGTVGPSLAHQYLGNAYHRKVDFNSLNPAAGEWWRA